MRAHIYFAWDEDLVLALYWKLNTELAARVSDLPSAPRGERFAALMRLKFALAATDAEVSAYGAGIRTLIAAQQSRCLETFSMEDLYEGVDYTAMRAHLCRHYSDSLEEIEARIHAHPMHQTLFNGIHRFLYEDTLGVETAKSKTQLRKEAKARTYQVVRRSDAWGRLLAARFPTALRLSIHPQGPHRDKIGILLGDADDAWLTPWHSVAVRMPDGFHLMPRLAAEELGAHPVSLHYRPYYYEMAEPS